MRLAGRAGTLHSAGAQRAPPLARPNAPPLQRRCGEGLVSVAKPRARAWAAARRLAASGLPRAAGLAGERRATSH